MKKNLSYWFTGLGLLFATVSVAQVELTLTVNDGDGATTCTDIFGGADVLWRVNIENQGWNVYPRVFSCFNFLPNRQYQERFDCVALMPAELEVCFSVFENDDLGFEFLTGCGLEPDCEETVCQRFPTPGLGESIDYTLELPDDGSSTGSVSFTMSLREVAGNRSNDDICDAFDLGVLEFGQQLGDAAAGGYSNICATTENEINPFDIGGWVNNAGVWFAFTTGDDPGPYLAVSALSDPQSMGDSLGVELAIFSADNDVCDGALDMLGFQFNRPDLDNELSLICPQPNTRYFVMVDGGPQLGEDKRGFFGIQVNSLGVLEGGDFRCDVEDLGAVPASGAVGTNGWRSNFCGTDTDDPFVRAFQSQHSVWFKFTTPPSGHVRIEGIADTSTVPLDVQLAAYRASSGGCTGFFRHLESVYTFEDSDEIMELQCLYPGEEVYVLVDGGAVSRGVFSLIVYDAGDITPVFTQDTTICAGHSIQVANSIYDQSGTYRDTINLFAGCDSVVVTNLMVLETVQVSVNIARPAVGAGAENGVAIAQATGGEGVYTYEWCNGETSERNDRLAGGTSCCVTVTDEAGCEGIFCFDVPQVLPHVIGSAADSLNCHADSTGAIRFSVQEGQAPYAYTWRLENGDGGGAGTIAAAGDTATLTGLPAGTYRIDVEDLYFDTSFTVLVEEPDPLAIALLEQVDPICYGFCDGRIALEATGGNGDYQWSWSADGLNGPAPDSICAGVYATILTDAKSCSDTLTLQLEEPLPFIAEAMEVQRVSCFEGADGRAEVTTNGNPIGYVWEDGQTEALAEGLAAGDYAVTVTNEDGCEAATQVTVTQPDAPVGVAIETISPVTCGNDADGILTAIPSGPGQAFDYRWSDGSMTARNEELLAGAYTVTVTNELGCEAETTAILEGPPPIEAQLFARDITCLDPPNAGLIEVVSVGGGRPGYTYSLDGVLFKALPVFEFLSAGTYTVTVRDSSGCQVDFEAEIQPPPVLTVSLGEDRKIKLGQTIQLVPTSNSADLSILWEPLPEGAAQGAPVVEVQPLETRRYAISVTDNTTFCTASDEVFIQVADEEIVYLPNAFHPLSRQEQNRGFTVFGGPGVEQVDFLRVFDRNGSLVFSLENFQPNDLSAAWDGTYNGETLTPGVFVYVTRVSLINGEKQTFSGDVTLIR